MDKIKGAIFDLDGTLLNSLWVWEEIDARFLGARGFDVPPDYSQAIAVMNSRQAAEYTVKRFNLNESPDELMAEWREMSREIYASEIKLKPLATEFLLALKERGIKLGVATSSEKELYMPALMANGVEKLFDVIMDTSTTEDKSSPDIYIKVAKNMGLTPNECVVFEDIPAALISAKSGGFKTVALYDKHSEHATDILKSTADYYAIGYKELMELL